MAIPLDGSGTRTQGVGQTSGGAGAPAATVAPSSRRPSTGANTRLLAELKRVADSAARQLGVRVTCSRLIQVYEPTDRDVALFELECDRGIVRAILSHSGEYSFFWRK